MNSDPRTTIDGFRLDGRVAIVTGASRGIGRAIAEALAGAGADLVLGARAGEALFEAARDIGRATGRRVSTIAGDVAERATHEALVREATETLGRVDILVNNAGLNRRGDTLDYTETDWDAVLGADLKGAFFLAQRCGQAMIDRGGGGKVINILSLASAVGLPGAPAYAAAKGGLTQVTKTLAIEWAPHGIQVNGIGPGFIRTTLNQAIQDDHRSEWVVRRTPARRWGETHELCGTALWLASSASNFVTGQVVYVDGGFLAGSDWRTGD